MRTKYEEIQNIHKLAFENHNANELRKVTLLLNDWGFKIREDDGELLWTNLSTPTSVGGTIIIGLRYKKIDESLTEDIFELNEKSPNEVTAYYKGRYQDQCTEYQRTHKLQDIEFRSFTSVNTCSLCLSEFNGS